MSEGTTARHARRGARASPRPVARDGRRRRPGRALRVLEQTRGKFHVRRGRARPRGAARLDLVRVFFFRPAHRRAVGDPAQQARPGRVRGHAFARAADQPHARQQGDHRQGLDGEVFARAVRNRPRRGGLPSFRIRARVVASPIARLRRARRANRRVADKRVAAFVRVRVASGRAVFGNRRRPERRQVHAP